MRDYKFRGKRIDNGEWVYGGAYLWGDKPYIIQKDIWDRVPLLATMVEVDPDTVGQYIPKEGFYEGDILYGEERNEYGTLLSVWYGLVKYDESTGRIRIEDDCGDWYETDDFVYNKVIGNIHDNVGLLQK